MVAYSLLLQQPETPLTETWVWAGDNIVSDDGTEQGISLGPVPKRGWSGSFAFASAESIRRHLATMFSKFKAQFDWPLWHLVVKLKAPVEAGDDYLACNTSRSDFRVGAKVFIVEGDTFETAIVDTIAADHIVIVGVLTNDYTARALLCPVASVYSSNGAALARMPTDGAGTATFSFYEYGFQTPFIAEGDEVELELFNGIPVLNRRPQGEQFGQSIDTGAEITDYGGMPSIRSRWLTARWAFSVSYLSQRMLDPTDWAWWRSFADYAKGSWKPFYVPSWRSDLPVYTEAAAAGTTIDLENTEYGDHYYSTPSFRTIMFSTEDGLQHLANVTARAVVSGRDRLTFNPALPAGDWADQIVSMLYRCRIADNTVTIEHQGPQSLVGLNLRTID